MEKFQEKVFFAIGRRFAHALFPGEVHALRIPGNRKRFPALHIQPNHAVPNFCHEPGRPALGRALVQFRTLHAGNQQKLQLVHHRAEGVQRVFPADKIVLIRHVFVILQDACDALLHIKQLLIQIHAMPPLGCFLCFP